ncbi:class I SAM-dependent methyltransferase [soil metagenome]
MADPRAELLRSGYAPVAPLYREHLLDELAGKPLDRAFLIAFADECCKSPGRVADLGCGPGHVAGFLAADSPALRVEGLDLSPEMVTEARAAFPTVSFRIGDLFALPYADGELRGATLFYAIVHIPTDELAIPFRELFRVITPGGLAALAFHQSTVASPHGEQAHVDELFGTPTSLDFVFHDPALVAAALDVAGFAIEARLDRAPYSTEHPTHRTYLLARKPAGN